MKRLLCAAAVAVFGLGFVPSAHADEDCHDCVEPPYVGRMPNYHIDWSDDREYDEHKFYDGTGFVKLEGRLYQKRFYLNDDALKASPLQITRTLANNLKAQGATIIMEGVCEAGNCGELHGWRVCLAKLNKDGKETWITIKACGGGECYHQEEMIIAGMGGGQVGTAPAPVQPVAPTPVVAVAAAPSQGAPTASSMQNALDADGHVALYINFETNKANIKPESMPIVEQIAALMSQAPALKISVEGHTDNSGDANKAKSLSQRRAKAVFDALVGKGISPSRLSTVGWGPDRPIADNDTDEGRAANRRVELVKK
jgi:OmpA-OmpF porin, OOP family